MDWNIIRNNWVEETVGREFDVLQVSTIIKTMLEELENEAEK